MLIVRLIELAISIIGMLGNWNNSDVLSPSFVPRETLEKYSRDRDVD